VLARSDHQLERLSVGQQVFLHHDADGRADDTVAGQRVLKLIGLVLGLTQGVFTQLVELGMPVVGARAAGRAAGYRRPDFGLVI